MTRICLLVLSALIALAIEEVNSCAKFLRESGHRVP